MNDTCGPTSGMPLAQYDPDERCWKTSVAISLWALTMSSLTLPPWGCLHDGELYELPTPALPTIEPGFSSLPTPMARDYKDLTLPPRLWGPKAYESELPTAIALHLMPTPKSSRGGAEATTIRPSGSKGSVNLEGAVALLPTPAVNDMGAGKDPQAWDEWAARQKAADGRPAPHGKSLEQEALRVGATTQQPFTAGSTSSDDQHQPPLFNETDEIA